MDKVRSWTEGVAFLAVVICLMTTAACLRPATEPSPPSPTPPASAAETPTETTDSAVDEADSPGDVADAAEESMNLIRDYYGHLAAGRYDRAHRYLSRRLQSRNGLGLDQYIAGMEMAYKELRLVEVLPYAQWQEQEGLTGGAAHPDTYAIVLHEEWKEDWIPVRPAGDNTYFVRVIQEEGHRRIDGFGTAP